MFVLFKCEHAGLQILAVSMQKYVTIIERDFELGMKGWIVW